MNIATPLSQGHPTDRILGNSPAIQALRAQIRHLAAFDTIGSTFVPTVVLSGQTGTGKGLVARAIHDSGPRASGPFIEVNCAAIPETLLEAELFGFEAGAFTDAKRAKLGLFEAASAGTLFLDEIDALPLPLQAKLLTILETKRVRRLGAVAEHPIDVKLIAATQVDLPQHVTVGRFRADLYHRLAVVLLEVPPLHQRGEDILLLAREFLRQSAEAHGLRPKRLSQEVEAWLLRHRWPGNVRELRHLMERATLLCPETVLTLSALAQLSPQQAWRAMQSGPVAASAPREIQDEPTRIRQALLRTGGNVARAARALGLTRKALLYRMRRYGIERPSWAELTAALTSQHGEAPPWPTESAHSTPRQEPAGHALGWEQKRVAVLMVNLTFPPPQAFDAMRYEPWTIMAR